jgi:hypothetical protein
VSDRSVYLQLYMLEVHRGLLLQLQLAAAVVEV